MIVIFKSVLTRPILMIVLVSICGVLSRGDVLDSARVSDRLYENREEHGDRSVDFHHHHHHHHHSLYHTSKHVFYWLFTSDNADGQMLNRSEPHMIESTTYDARNPTKVVVHGWLGTTQEKEGFCTCTYRAYLKVSDYNVICVDWRQYSTDLSYAGAKMRAKHIAKDIAMVLNRITYDMTRGVKGLHLIGHSMGAHIVGFVGKNLTDQVPRITALDPAKPLYENNDPEDRLNTTDADFVDVMHTNGDKNGILRPLGHIDFFPNGGQWQPNCPKKDKATGSCSHIKSYFYFAHSIWAPQDYVSYKCSSWDEYKTGDCAHSESTYMGEHVDKIQTGDYYLKTTKEDICSG